MSSVEWNKKEDLVAEQALRHLRVHHENFIVINYVLKLVFSRQIMRTPEQFKNSLKTVLNPIFVSEHFFRDPTIFSSVPVYY